MTKKALIIGVNYIGQAGELGGCINDAWNVCSFLTHHYGYEPQNVTLLSDDPDHVGSGLPPWAPPIPDPEKERKKKKKDKKKKKKKKKKKTEDEDEDEYYEEDEEGEYEEDEEEGEYEEDEEGEYEEDEDEYYEEDEEGEDEDEYYEDDEDTSSKKSKKKSKKSKKKGKKPKKSRKSRAIEEDEYEDESYEGYGEDIAYYAYQFTAACRGVEEISRGGPASVKRDTATRANIIRGIEWLVDGAQPGDELFFHFSGHGGQQEDEDGDEDDGYDETICPQDYETAGVIVDDELHEILVEPLPEGVHLQALLDCCHSGTGLDLPFVYKASGPPGTPFEDKSSKKGKKKKKSKTGIQEAGAYKESEATVVMISGCQDDQCSIDFEQEGTGTGAVTFSFISALMSNGFELSYADLLYTMKEILAENFESDIQCPQLSTNTEDFDFDQPFFC